MTPNVRVVSCLLLAIACRRDAEPPPAAARPRADIARLARDTLLDHPRGVVWTAAMHAAAEAGYGLEWFDTRAGAAEFASDSGLWMRITLSAADEAAGAGTRVAVLAARAPTHASGSGERRPRSSVPDDSAAARAGALVRAIASRAATGDASLAGDTTVVAIGTDTVESCRGSALGEFWVEIDYRRDTRRCATPRLFGMQANVSVMQRVEDLPLYSLVETCSVRARVPRGFSVGYSHHDDARCGGRDGVAANVLVLRKAF